MNSSVDVEKFDVKQPSPIGRTSSASESLSEPDRDRQEEKSRHSGPDEDGTPHRLGEPSKLQNDVPSATRAQSTAASSTRSRTASIVPRSRRRGLFGRFTVIPEVDRPYDYRNKTKWTITLVVALAAAGAPLGSAIFYRMLYAALNNDEQ
jgi:hypothetical protein